jgi:hypothetical protein
VQDRALAPQNLCRHDDPSPGREGGILWAYAPAPRGPARYGAPPVETRRPARQSWHPKYRRKRVQTLIRIIDGELGRLVAAAKNDKLPRVPRVQMIVAATVRAQAWSPNARQMHCQLHSVTAGLLTRPGRVMTVCKATEAGSAVGQRTLAKVGSPPMTRDTPAEACRWKSAARTSYACTPRDAAR